MELKEKTLELSILLKILTDKFIRYINKEESKQTDIVIFKKYIKRYIENLRNNNEIECLLLLEAIKDLTKRLYQQEKYDKKPKIQHKNIEKIETIIELTQEYIQILYEIICILEEKQEKLPKNLTKKNNSV